MPIFLGTALGLALSLATGPKAKPCTREAADAADAAVDVAHESWANLHEQYLKYAKAMDCDDGDIAEGWDDAVARLLANSWDQFPTFAKLAKADPQFRAFVMRHLGGDAGPDDVKRAQTNAEQHCMRKYRDLCRAISAEAAAALLESSPPPVKRP